MRALPDADSVIAAALAEDLGVRLGDIVETARAGTEILERDVTSSAVVPPGAAFSGWIVARSAGVVCGLPVAARAFELLARASASEPPECFPLVAEGAHVNAGAAVMEVEGDARVVLAAERTALDILMVLSGIATEARRWSEAAGPDLEVVDTRKTLPGLRVLSKYATAVGGAVNHRSGLYDMVLVKDNHIAYAGGVGAAVRAARTAHPALIIEAEADTVIQAVEAAEAGADIVLLDNMDDHTLADAVAAVQEAARRADAVCLTEASGGVTIERLGAIRAAGCDRVSTSAITLAPTLDFGLDEA